MCFNGIYSQKYNLYFTIVVAYKVGLVAQCLKYQNNFQ